MIKTAAGMIGVALAVAPASYGQTPDGSRLPAGMSVQIAGLIRDAQARQKAWASAHPGYSPDAAAAPKLISGSIDKAVVNVQTPADAPSATLKYAAGPSGLYSLYLYFLPPSGMTFQYVSYFTESAPTAGILTIKNGDTVNPYSQPGNWTLVDAFIENNAGGYVFYSGTALSKIFSNLTYKVTNSNPADIKPPMVASGKIATPTVKLSAARPVFVANLVVSDNLSGVSYAYVTLMDPSGSLYSAFANAPSPEKKATSLPVGLFFYPGGSYATGMWTITSVQVTDVAGNTYTVNDSATLGKLFPTTTFQVTN